jgi:hypothetical protein
MAPRCRTESLTTPSPPVYSPKGTVLPPPCPDLQGGSDRRTKAGRQVVRCRRKCLSVTHTHTHTHHVSGGGVAAGQRTPPPPPKGRGWCPVHLVTTHNIPRRAQGLKGGFSTAYPLLAGLLVVSAAKVYPLFIRLLLP